LDHDCFKWNGLFAASYFSDILLTQINSINKDQQFREAMMQNDNSHGSCASVRRGFIALFAMLAMGLGLMARPTEAAPFAYVANETSNNVSVIDTATNTVVATVPVGITPLGSPLPRMGNTYTSRVVASTLSRRSTRPATRWWPQSR
jgi:YVTN family beta-propeller protein